MCLKSQTYILQGFIHSLEAPLSTLVNDPFVYLSIATHSQFYFLFFEM